MTDLERARLTYGVIRDFGWDVLWRSANPIPDDAWPIDIIANALAAARREGAERAARVDKEMLINAFRTGAAEMRERAARECDLEDNIIHAARSIRELPLTPPEGEA